MFFTWTDKAEKIKIYSNTGLIGKVIKTGKFLNLDHSTIIHQVKSAKYLLEYDSYFREVYSNVENEFLSQRKNTIEGIKIDIEMLENQKDYLKKQFFYATLQEATEATKAFYTNG